MTRDVWFSFLPLDPFDFCLAHVSRIGRVYGMVPV